MDELGADEKESPALADQQGRADQGPSPRHEAPVIQVKATHPIPLASLAITISAFAVWAWWSTHSLSAEVFRRCHRSVQIAEDAARIRHLRGIPQAIREGDAPETWLLERVSNAMQSAGLTPQHLVSTAPQPSRAIDGSDLSELTQSLELESVSIQDLTRFAAALSDSGSVVRVSEIQLRARPSDPKWNAELGTSCLTAAPLRVRMDVTKGH